MKIQRTNKQFTNETVTLEFMQQALSIGGLHSIPLKFKEEDFVTTLSFHGVRSGGSTYPWKDESAAMGYTKEPFIFTISHNKGFDSEVSIFCKTAKLQGRYKESGKMQYAPDSIEWINLLLEYGFVEII